MKWLVLMIKWQKELLTVLRTKKETDEAGKTKIVNLNHDNQVMIYKKSWNRSFNISRHYVSSIILLEVLALWTDPKLHKDLKYYWKFMEKLHVKLIKVFLNMQLIQKLMLENLLQVQKQRWEQSKVLGKILG